MGRASKLFASRKASVASLPNATTSNEGSPYLTKAERLLGASGLPDASRHQLPRRPSYISLKPSLSEVPEDADYDDFSSPDHFGLDPLPLRLADLHQKGVENAMTRRVSSNETYSRSTFSERSRRIKGSWSSTTLNTRYESANTSESHSRQPSNTSGRNHLTRPGLPQVYEPDNRRPSTASVDSRGYSRHCSIDQTTALPDMSRLHPHVANRASVHSSHSATRVTTGSQRFPGAAPQSRPNTSAGSLKKVAGNATRSLRGHLSVESIRIFSRRSHAPSPVSPSAGSANQLNGASKHWWDSLPMEADESDAESEHDPNLVTPTENTFPGKGTHTPSPRPSEVHTFNSSRSSNVHPIRHMGSAHEITSAKSSVTLRSLQQPLRSRPTSSMTINDLRETSILSTSSTSDSDSELEADDSELQSSTIRDSIAVSELHVHHVGQAQLMPLNTMRRVPESASSDRRPSLASISSMPTTTDSSSIQSGNQGPAYLSVPNRAMRNRKSGHFRQPSSIPEDSDTSEQIASPISPPASMHSFSSPYADNRRLMAVTEEEEALLEMMRRKRADKAAQRDSGLASVTSSTARSTRPFSNLSGSSSILDSFPISRSQRSSLLASRTTTSQTAQEQPTGSKELERGRNRQSIATTATENSYYSIDSRLESPKRLKYAFTPHLSLASLDVSFAGLPSAGQDDTAISSPDMPDSPVTPFTRRGSAELQIYGSESNRDSIASHPFGDRPSTSDGVPREELDGMLQKKKSTTSIPQPSAGTGRAHIQAKTPVETNTTITNIVDEESRLPIDEISSSGSSNRTSTISKNTSECGSACGHAGCAGNRRTSAGYSSIGTRCSVSEDVLAAWGSLGGWREMPGVM